MSRKPKVNLVLARHAPFRENGKASANRNRRCGRSKRSGLRMPSSARPDGRLSRAGSVDRPGRTGTASTSGEWTLEKVQRALRS